MKELVLSRVQSFRFDDVFVTDMIQGKEYSYDEFFSRCLFIIQRLDSHCVPNKVVCIMDNSIELMACYFAIILSGRVAVAIDPVKGREEINGILSALEECYILVDKTGKEKVEHYDEVVIRNGFNSFEKADGSEIKTEVLNLLEKRDFQDDCLLTFTSGTSGNTKGVRNSLYNLCSTAETFNSNFEISNKNIFAHLMPMTYMAGILNTIIQPFIAGAKIAIMGRFSPMLAFTFWQNVAKYEINTLWMSPSMLNIINKVGNEKVGSEYCMDREMLFLIGTAPLQQKTRQVFEGKYGVTLYASYGLSETLFLSTQTKDTVSRGDDNVGRILDGVKYKFSEQGEFLVDVPWMYLGYTNENTSDYFDGTYYKTGDLAEIEDGVLKIVGRAKDLIIKGGMNISSALIEKVVGQIDEVDECAVFGIVNNFQEECIVLAYSSGDTGHELEKKINAVVLEKLGKNYAIDLFYRIPSIPKNINGKTDKNSLKESFKQNDNQV